MCKSLLYAGVEKLIVLNGAALSLVTTPHVSTRDDPHERKRTVSMTTTDTGVMVAIAQVHMIESEIPAICQMMTAINERRKGQRGRRRSIDTVMRVALLRAQGTITNT